MSAAVHRNTSINQGQARKEQAKIPLQSGNKVFLCIAQKKLDTANRAAIIELMVQCSK